MPKKRTLPFIQADARIKPALALGHPWIYRDAITRGADDLTSGTWVHVQCGNLQQYGLWDAEGAIAVRLFAANNPPNRAWVHEQVQRAWRVRAPLRAWGATPAALTTAYRWLYGESDGLPGVVVDLYGEVGENRAPTQRQWAVLRTYSPSLESIKGWVVDALAATVSLAGIVERTGDAVHLLQGEMPPEPLMICENGVRFEADLIHGQKTGFFLDQRDNRRAIAQWSRAVRPQRVLNLFAYTGGFSVCAALGVAAGASSTGTDASAAGSTVQVTSVDSAQPALDAARRNFAHNGLDQDRHEFVAADCFDLLAKYHGEGRRFDLIIVDPPSFARARAQLEKALHAYRRLNALAIKCLEPGGLLASSSCTSQVSPEAFRQMLAEAASDAKRQALIVGEAGQPLDHPVPAHFPEARYLKFVISVV